MIVPSVLGIIGLALLALLTVGSVTGKLKAAGFLIGLVVMVIPVLGMAAYTFVAARKESTLDDAASKRRRILDLVATAGTVRISDLVNELRIPQSEIRDHVTTLCGQNLFTGYVNWNQGLMISRQASELSGGKCPGCGGDFLMAGKGIAKCDSCGSEVFLKG